MTGVEELLFQVLYRIFLQAHRPLWFEYTAMFHAKNKNKNDKLEPSDVVEFLVYLPEIKN